MFLLNYSKGNFKFKPRSIPGAAKNPPHLGVTCSGLDLSETGKLFAKNYKNVRIEWLKEFYDNSKNKKKFFNSYFNKLAGNATLKQQIISGTSIEDIRQSWQAGLSLYKVIRKKYLLYPDFE